MTPREFETQAREIMSAHFGSKLSESLVDGVPKRFDYVSQDGSIVGDAKYYTMVGGERLPPAKFATIAEHVWLLEKSRADQKFLVFGNDRRVPKLWLDRYGHLVTDVDFYFLEEGDSLEQLKRT